MFKQQMFDIPGQNGFTLVELIVALVLGVLITAAAGQMLITSQISFSLQKANSDLQDSGNFGLNYLASDIKKTNNKADKSVVSLSTVHGGVVFDSRNVASSTISTNYSTKGLVGLSNTDKNSDQLTIQYYVDQDGVYDCEGRLVAVGQYVVQRYFLRLDSTTTAEANQPLALACKAASYNGNATDLDTLLSGNGEIIVRRVDHLHIRFGLAKNIVSPTTPPVNSVYYRYMDINDYLSLADSNTRIISIQLAMIMRSNNSVKNNTMVQDSPSYSLLNQSLTIKTPTTGSDKFMRDPVIQTIALRNGQESIL